MRSSNSTSLTLRALLKTAAGPRPWCACARQRSERPHTGGEGALRRGGVRFTPAERDGNDPTRARRGRAGRIRRRTRGAGRWIVFTNGVFDILHPGHVRYLQAARTHGDVLIVGVNSDVSVRRNKGPGRPINPEAERAEVVAALACVDGMALFDEDTPAAIIARVQPDVLVKGAD
jgi:rfaE bifunctional protein nucleotidyltransferase chain/domain